MGAASQFRMIGAAATMAIATSVFNSHVKPEIAGLLGLAETSSILGLGGFLDNLPPDVQEQLRLILAEGYNRQMIVLSVCSALQIPTTLLLWRKKQVVV